MGVNMLIGIGFESLYKGLDYLINYEEKQKEVFEKAKSATEEAAKSIHDLKTKMSDTSAKPLSYQQNSRTSFRVLIL